MAVVRAKIREIFMPALSSTMTEGKIVSWTAAEGDRLAKGDPVVVVESDKADMDVETFHDGFLAAVLVPAGESAPVGSAIALLAESEEEIPVAQSQAASFSSSSPSPPPPQETAAEEASLPPPPPPSPAPVAVSAPARPSPATQGGCRYPPSVCSPATETFSARRHEMARSKKPRQNDGGKREIARGTDTCDGSSA